MRNEYFYQVLAEKDVERVLPSVEELLKRSFYQSGLKLAEVYKPGFIVCLLFS